MRQRPGGQAVAEATGTRSSHPGPFPDTRWRGLTALKYKHLLIV